MSRAAPASPPASPADPPSPGLPPRRLERRVPLLTPEMVLLDQPLAGVGRRGMAFLIDVAIRWGTPLVLLSVARNLFPLFFQRTAGHWWVLTLGVVAVFVAQFLYHLLFEAFWNGQTPGKRLLGIRVVEERGRPATLLSSAVRNLIRIVDALPLSYGIGVLFIFLHPRHQRLGDMAAGTLVLRTAEAAAPDVSRSADRPPPWIAVRHLTLEVFRWERIVRFLRQGRAMEEEPRKILERKLLADALREAAPAPEGPEYRVPPPPRALREIVETCRLRGVTGRDVTAFLHHRWEDWRRLQEILREVGLRGLGRLEAGRLEEMGHLYRSAAADLAWMRTHLPGAALEHHLNDLVLQAHDLVYQGERTGLPDLVRLYREEVPRVFRRNLGPILVAAGLFLLSGFGAFVVSSIRPDVAEALVGRQLLDEYVRQERLWTDDFFNVVPGSYASLKIVTNNITVTFAAFALGITLGVGTVWILTLNGVHLGSVFAVCASYGLAGRLGLFVLAHGFLEIVCILIAGGAGLMLGGAIINPADLRRREALVVRGREAVVLLLGTTPALVVAGLVESYISPVPALPAWSKALLGLGLAVLFLLWLSVGGAPEASPDEGSGPDPLDRPGAHPHI